ncbi:uncharacterized protein LOC110819223 [Carica papaya]|uniref:uncharacterized protein LOC110819223 n=1 Tax=Carica papaya TaxID=3649 RepID=UPI000B8CFBA6|nr:uncharacterized protein LOC110819223 [Carica papaya]
MDLKRKEMIVSALCQYFSLDPKPFLEDIPENDIKDLYSKISKASTKASSLENNDEVAKWITFADPSNSKASVDILKELNEDLAPKSVLSGNGLRPSEVDVIVFSSIHSLVADLSDSDKEKLPHLMRWIDYIQNKENLWKLFGTISLQKPGFEYQLPGTRTAAKVEVDSNAKKTAQGSRSADRSEAEPSTKKGDSGVNFRFTLFIVSFRFTLFRVLGLVPMVSFMFICILKNRKVVLITNVKPGKLRDVMSEGLVLCASNEDHTVVEPLHAPEGAKPGECISFSGIDGKPEDVLNPKKKQLEKITPHLFTDDKGVATYKGIPFMTTAGPCTSSIPKASIK